LKVEFLLKLLQRSWVQIWESPTRIHLLQEGILEGRDRPLIESCTQLRVEDLPSQSHLAEGKLVEAYRVLAAHNLVESLLNVESRP